MKTSNARIVAQYLFLTVDALNLDGREEKVYHELRDSYSWRQLLEEVEKGSEVGKRFVDSLTEVASKEGVGLKKFLKG